MKRGFLNSSKAKKASEGLYSKVDARPLEMQASSKSANLSYGKVSEAGRPEGYEREKRIFQEQPGEKIDYHEEQLVYTTLPAKYFGDTLADNPDGWTECLVEGPIKRQLVSAPGFPSPLSKPDHVSHRIGPTACMGLGMFATRALKTGDLILSERPLFILPIRVRSRIGYPSHFSQEQIRQAMIFEWEKMLEMSLKRMDPESRKAFIELANNHEEDGSGPILGRVRTNGYGVDGLYHGNKEHGRYSAVLKDMSRINHSCCPNTAHSFDYASLSFRLRAIRDIKVGEQLFYSYCDSEQPVAQRQEELAPYGIKCTCLSCSTNTPGS